MKMFQVLNLTELELNRVDVRVGLSGALYYMDGSSQAVRQLRGLVSQVASPLKCIFHFNLRWLFALASSQLFYHPFVLQITCPRQF